MVEKSQSNLDRKLAEANLVFEEEKNRRLKSEIDLQNVELEVQRLAARQTELFKSFTLGLSLLILALIVLLAFATKKTKEVKLERKRLRLVMDSVEEGLLTIDRDLRIEPGYSKHLDRMFSSQDGELLGLDLVNAVFSYATFKENELSIIKEVLNLCIGETELNWSMNAGHLPTVLLLKNDPDSKFILRWVPILDKQAHVVKVLLTISNISDLERIHRQLEEAEFRANVIQERWLTLCKQSSDKVQPFLSELGVLIEDLLRIKEFPNKKQLRQIHTFKGNARSMGLTMISDLLHRLETSLDSSKPLMNAEDILRLMTTEIYEENRVMDLLSDQKSHLESTEDVFSIVYDIMPSIGERLAENDIKLKALHVSSDIQTMSTELRNVIRTVLMHSLNNAADHGYILPEQGRGLNKVAEFTIDCTIVDEQLILKVGDKGAGIDWESLKAKAKGLSVAYTDAAELLELVFEDRISTAKELSQSSGRGVGLAALKEIADSHQGSVTLRENQDHGVSLEMKIKIPSGSLKTA
ncbi:MAG: Hpt domain-containing protein [Pseudobacteriovorax sp.]|nr:Hpt domain-containing protein [Pseudobacteriovorax sp.]